jgi:membrane protein DedA with SNARE-associated domain
MAAFLEHISSWIATIPLGALYALLGIAAFIEGIFPPVPADLVVALGSFLAARRGASLPVTAACIVAGSVAGAMVVYGFVRRFGASWLHARLKKAGIDNVEKRLELMYSHYGMTALFVSRFLPVFRAVAPPMAGAMRIPPVRTAAVFVLASSIWYGAIAWIAFRVGDDWTEMQAALRHFSRRVGVVAIVAAALFAIVVIIAVRHRATERLAEVMADEASNGTTGAKLETPGAPESKET